MEPLRRLRHPLRLISAYSSPRKDQGVVGPPDETVRLSAGASPRGPPAGTPKRGPRGPRGGPRPKPVQSPKTGHFSREMRFFNYWFTMNPARDAFP